jgi:hypothetical protein
MTTNIYIFGAIFKSTIISTIFNFLKMTQVWYCITWNCVSHGACVCVCVCVCARHKWLVFRYTRLMNCAFNNTECQQYTLNTMHYSYYFCQRQRCIYHKGMWWTIGSASYVEKSLETAHLLTPLHCYTIFSCVACIIRQTSINLCGHVTACDVSYANRCCLSVSLCY